MTSRSRCAKGVESGLVESRESFFPRGTVLSGLIILATGLLSVRIVGGLGRWLLEAVAGWTFEAGWQRAFLTILALLTQNAVWLSLSLSYLGEGRFGRALSFLGLRWRGWGEIWAGLGWGWLLLMVNGLSSRLSLALWSRWLPEHVLSQRLERERGALLLVDEALPDWLLAGFFFAAVVVAPIVEEVLFRGLLHNALRVRVGRAAILVSSGLFAVTHLYIINFLPVFALGVLLAWLYERRGSLWAPIVAHAFANGMVAVAYMAYRAGQLGV